MFKRFANIILAVLIFSSALFFLGCSKEALPVIDEKTNTMTDEVEEISFGVWEIRAPQSAASIMIYDYIKANFKIDIKPITLSTDNWRSELDWMAGANQLPDVFMHDVTDNKLQYKQLINAGALSFLPKEIWGKMQRLSEVLSWYEDVYSVNDKMYFIPRTYQTFDQTHGSTNVIYYRKDWAQNLSYSSFDTDIEFTDIIKLLSNFRASDPDNNTIWDTWGITGSGGIDFLWSMFLEPFGVRSWVIEDGRWIPGLLSDSAKQAMAWAAQLYRDGVIDPDIADQTPERAMQKFLSSKAGMLLAPAYYSDLLDFETQWAIYNPDTSIENSVRIMPSYKTPKGTISNEVDTFKGGSLISSNITDGQMYKILKLYNWMYSPQGRNYLIYGSETVENYEYQKDEQSFSSQNT